MAGIIEVEDLTKRFGDFTAVKGISFSVAPGEIFAFLGPNGAGKSTTIKMLITLLEPSSGQATVAWLDLMKYPGEIRKSRGYVPQSISVDGTLTAYENLMLMAGLYDVPHGEREQRVYEVLEFLKLRDFSKALVRTFSGGMVRKMEIGQAMLNRPKVLFLDEPTTGLDPLARQNVWEHLHELQDAYGTTIFFSTHYMDEADDNSDRVAIMNQGQIAVMGSAEQLKQQAGKPGATLEDAFIFFTGNSLTQQATASNWREIRRTRQTEKRLG